jgi:hypothetical protein
MKRSRTNFTSVLRILEFFTDLMLYRALSLFKDVHDLD